MRSVWNRCWKTFVETFICALIPNITAIIADIPNYNLADWKLWAIQFGLPALASAISATWNKVENYIKSKETEE